MRVRLRTKEWCLANGWYLGNDGSGLVKQHDKSQWVINWDMVKLLGQVVDYKGEWSGEWSAGSNFVVADSYIWPKEIVPLKQHIINEFFKEN